MTLFKTKEYWSTNIGHQDVFDCNSLTIGSIGENDESIILGSHKGLLQIFKPTSGSSVENSSLPGYRASDLLLEVQLPQPILQVGIGLLLSGSKNNLLAILHPDIFSVYAFNKTDNEDSVVGDQVTLQLCYQHELKRSAYSFLTGPFGGVQNRDFICIQSLDGLLTFYEQESFTFSLFIPEYLLPGPIMYLHTSDSFVLCNANMSIDCYSYETLASVGHASDDISTSKKKINKIWTHNIGEYVNYMKSFTTDAETIMLITQHTMYSINQNGGILYSKRLDFKVLAYYGFVLNKSIMNILATDSNVLNIYENIDLKWSTKLDLTPVAIDRIFNSTLKGGLVLLSDDGYLQVTYLGTHPALFVIPPLTKQEINVVKSEKELADIQTKILQADSYNIVVDKVDDIVMKIAVSDVNPNDKSCRINLSLTPQSPINKVQILFIAERPICFTQKCIVISSLCAKSEYHTHVYLTPGQISDLKIIVCLCYILNNSPKVIKQETTLPFNFVMELCSPAKEAEYKVTINSNKAVVNVNQIFSEFNSDNNNVIGLKFVNSDDVVTMLAAKTSQRYRLQADKLEHLTIVLQQLVHRLQTQFKKTADFTLSFSSNLYLQNYFEYLEKYNKLKQQKLLITERLSKQTSQYRLIEKKLLINLKEVTPKPLTHLSSILKDTYNMISTTCDEYDVVEENMEQMKLKLSSFSRLIIELVKLLTISNEDLSLLKIVFNPNIQETEQEGWLEVQEASIAYLLRTKLAKSNRDQQKPKDISLELLKDVNKLCKHIVTAVDRVTKGASLLERNEYEGEYGTTDNSDKFKEEVETANLVPSGSKMVDLRTSAIPAKLTSLWSNRRPDRQNAIEIVEDEPTVMEDTKVITTEKKEEEETMVDTTVELEIQEKSREDVITELKEIDSYLSKNVNAIQDDDIWDVTTEEMRI